MMRRHVVVRMKRIKYFDFMGTSSGNSCCSGDRRSVVSIPLDIRNDLPDADPWPVRVTLTKSDVDRKMASLDVGSTLINTYIVPNLTLEQQEMLVKEEGIDLQVRDLDQGGAAYPLHLKLHGRRYRFKRSWWSAFVNRRKLRIGQRIGLRWNHGLEFKVLEE